MLFQVFHIRNLESDLCSPLENNYHNYSMYELSFLIIRDFMTVSTLRSLKRFVSKVTRRCHPGTFSATISFKKTLILHGQEIPGVYENLP